jgi:HrpA-like RNA helicase
VGEGELVVPISNDAVAAHAAAHPTHPRPCRRLLAAAAPPQVASIRWIIANGEPGALLVFMPGLMEISKLHEACHSDPTIRNATGGGQYVIALHSALASADQGTVGARLPDLGHMRTHPTGV